VIIQPKWRLPRLPTAAGMARNDIKNEVAVGEDKTE
jgi:hypothetical protein